MRVLEFIYTAVLATQVADVGDKQYGLQGCATTEKTCPDEPLGEVE
jgi:hypothetical protein